MIADASSAGSDPSLFVGSALRAVAAVSSRPRVPSGEDSGHPTQDGCAPGRASQFFQGEDASLQERRPSC
jgi:hypothetical protein